MEDPWSNAWGDPPKSEQSSNPPPSSTWTPSSKFVTDDQADIAIPSWDVDSGTIWDDSQDFHKDMWGRDNRISQLWTTPTLDSIGFAKPPQEPRLETSEPDDSPQEFIADAGSSDASENQETYPTIGTDSSVGFRPPTPDSEREPPKTNPTTDPSPTIASRVLEVEEGALGETLPDSDGFGTFEVAKTDDPRSVPWALSHPDFAPIEQPEDWGTTWKASDETESDNREPVDEWEIARKQKEIQDQYVVR